MRWQGKPSPSVFFAFSKELGVSRQEHCFEAGSFHSLPNVDVDFVDFTHVDLEHLKHTGCCLANFLVDSGGPAA